MQLRRAAFAGSWYPHQAAACEAQIHRFLSGAAACEPAERTWLAGVVPHAGWYFSGDIACRVIDCLKGTEPIDLVVLFGMHLHPSSACHMMPEGAWETPFGELAVETGLADHLLKHFSFQLETPGRNMPDNTIEIQLPFVKYLLDPAAILALGVPPAPGSLAIARAVSDWARDKGKRTRIIGSTDLTHYGRNYSFTPQGDASEAISWARGHNDRRIIDAMLSMDPHKVITEGLASLNACCPGAAAAAIEAARMMGADQSRQVAYSSSYDKSPGDSFVGYAGLLFGK